ncbi:MAG: ATP synthase F0 subunit A [Anaerolinea sp. 4484_236]|nr:MAG: ATP synthase F0 subunit A [Anaerolinea sp. 4484_236]RLD09401.1 MAG: ATP synthase F0 subunit A [Chloroflexota bacterium]
MKKFGKVLVAVVAVGLLGVSFILGPLGEGFVVRPFIQMPAEFFHIGAVPVPNSLVGALIADLVLIIGMAVGTRRIRAGNSEALVPTGAQNFVEMIYEFIADLLGNILGEKGKKMLPLLLTFFLFILVANWIELFPGFDSIGVIEHVHEGHAGNAIQSAGPFKMLTNEPGEYTLVPYMRAAATDLNIPLALALVSVVMTQVFGIQELGWSYFSRFINIKALTKGGMMGIIDFVVGLLETLSEFIKIISFAFRLFGNVFAGMVLLLVISSLLPFMVPVVFYFLELFVGAVQALVFVMLTSGFIVVAIAGHGDDH